LGISRAYSASPSIIRFGKLGLLLNGMLAVIVVSILVFARADVTIGLGNSTLAWLVTAFAVGVISQLLSVERFKSS
jgi:hypothetical protein